MTIPVVEEFKRTRRAKSGEQAQSSTTSEAPAYELKRDGKDIRFQRGEKLGKGSFGVVYKAINHDSGELIAVKQVLTASLKDDQKAAIETEVKLMDGLNHKNVVRSLGSQNRAGYLLILMEYVAGRSLFELIKEFNRLNEAVVRNYMTQILEGLVYCHERKVVHRDIKAKNILVTADGTLKLADFGSAKLVDDILKDQGVSVGYNYTPLWLAPEVVFGKYTSKVDIWSVGCVMIEMASGKDPWSEETFENSFQALYYIAKSDKYPKFPSNLSPLALDFLKACFTRDPEARPSAAQLLKHDFIVKGAPPPSPSRVVPLTPLSPAGSTVGTFSTQKTDTSSVSTSPTQRSTAQSTSPTTTPTQPYPSSVQQTVVA
jgi:serine/threonine protein kinase